MKYFLLVNLSFLGYRSVEISPTKKPSKFLHFDELVRQFVSFAAYIRDHKIEAELCERRKLTIKGNAPMLSDFSCTVNSTNVCVESEKYSRAFDEEHEKSCEHRNFERILQNTLNAKHYRGENFFPPSLVFQIFIGISSA